MSIATEIQRLRTAKEDIKTAIEEKGVEVGDGLIDTYAEKIKEITGGGGDVIDFARNAKTFQMGSTEGLPEEITFNFDYMTTFTDFWRAVVNKTVKRVTLNINTKPTVLTRLFSQNNVEIDERAIEHITIYADTSSVTHFTQMFYAMSNLKIVDGSPIDFSSATNVNMWCESNPVLEEVRVAEETIKINMSISAVTTLSVDSLLSFLYGLYDYSTDTSGTSRTLTIGTKNLNKLTDTQKAIATEKGWNLA